MLIVVGLGLVGQVEAAKMNFTAENTKDLLLAVAYYPENIELIKNKVIGKEGSLETEIVSLKQNIETLVGYKVGGSFKNKKMKMQKITEKTGALLKLAAVSNVMQISASFLQNIHDIATIIRDKMILPILTIAGQQSLIDPFNKLALYIETYKTKILAVDDEIKRIYILVSKWEAPAEAVGPRELDTQSLPEAAAAA